MKLCKYCGREGPRMVEVRSFFGRPDGWKCAHPIPYARRRDQLGQWHGKRVLYRQDADGTRWTIRRLPGSSLYTLTCEYRQHRMMTSHFTIEAAKSHRDEVERSLESRNLREYIRGAR